VNVVVVGSGFREHAWARACRASALVDQVIVAPGNAGAAEVAECRAATTPEALAALAKDLRALVLIGPEQPLAGGWADYLRGEGIAVMGPSQRAAQVESSKADTKALMQRLNIPTARAVTATSWPDVSRALAAWSGPVVVKADGLAAGKGVVLADDPEAGLEAARALMVERRFGDAANRVVLEERLKGVELSAMAITDGRRVCWLPPSQDYKRLADGDVGPNTGGMGAVAPHREWTDALAGWLMDRVYEPLLAELAREGRPFRGVLYAGLMLTAEGPKVLEWNARLGDPEACVTLPLLTRDAVPYWWGAAVGELPEQPLTWTGAAVGVVMAAAGYPERGGAGTPVSYTVSDGAWVLEAGTRRVNGEHVSGGGRTLLAVAQAATVEAARAAAYAQVARVAFPGMLVRHDIGAGYSHS